MNKSAITQRAIKIQGITSKYELVNDSQLPTFTVSDRRTVTDRHTTILEEGTPQTDFENITIESPLNPETKIIVFEFAIQTDFFWGYGNISISDIGVLVLNKNEEIKTINITQSENQYYPTITLTNDIVITPHGRNPK